MFTIQRGHTKLNVNNWKQTRWKDTNQVHHNVRMRELASSGHYMYASNRIPPSEPELERHGSGRENAIDEWQVNANATQTERNENTNKFIFLVLPLNGSCWKKDSSLVLVEIKLPVIWTMTSVTKKTHVTCKLQLIQLVLSLTIEFSSILVKSKE